jgi:hypothetical protein
MTANMPSNSSMNHNIFCCLQPPTLMTMTSLWV